MKTKTSFTPGPWSWEEGAPLRDPLGVMVLSISRPKAERMANQRLIASAPELLAACKLVRDAFKSARPWQLDDLGFKGAETALDAIDAAILKAEGSDE